jgi:hypothetical protein
MTEARLVTREQLAAALRANPFPDRMPMRERANAIFAALPVAAPAEGLREALDNLVVAVDALEARAIRSGGEFHVWAEERMVTEARDEARAALARLESAGEGT